MKSLRENSAAENILPGDHVLVAGKRAGIVHFVGNTEFAPGVFFRCCSVGFMYEILLLLVSETAVK